MRGRRDNNESSNEGAEPMAEADWGIALIAYLIVGSTVSRAIAGAGSGGVRFARTHRTATTPY
jgi:hypothetical protein